MKNSKIKICHIANTDMAVRFLLIGQLKFLKNEGYEVYAVCSAGKFVRDIELEGIKTKTINFKRKISPFSDLICLFKLFFYFKKEKFDIVHTHNPKPGLLGQLAARFAGIPIIINTIHGFYFEQSGSRFKRIFFILIEKIAARCSDLIFSVSQGIIDIAIKEKICKQDLLRYLGRDIDMVRFNPERFSKEFINKKKKALNLESDLKIIGIVGRLVKEKGYLDLFEAFKKVIEKFPKTLLLVIGPEEPEKKDKIKKNIVKNYGIEKKVLFLGQRTDVNELYSLMDVFVLPSYREGIGASILEASAMGKPVVTTNIPGCREAVDDRKTGILVPVKNPEKIAQAIIYLLDNPEIAQKMGENGRRKAEKEFDEKIIFDRIKTEYRRLVKEKLR